MNPKWKFTLLSKVQISQLCILATQAYKIAKQRRDPRADVDADTWRKNGQDEATNEQGLSLKTATQVHYLPIRGYWFVITGNVETAFWDFINAGEANEARRQMAWRLMGEVSHLAAGIQQERRDLAALTPGMPLLSDAEAATQAWNYTLALCRDKFAGRRVDGLNAAELEQLGFTVTGRANAKLKRGRPENRNKSQRRKAPKQSKSGSEATLERGLSEGLNRLPVDAGGRELVEFLE